MSSDTPQYGLPTPTNNQGDPEPVDFTFEWEDNEVKIKATEPTIAEMDKYEDLPDDLTFRDLFEIVDKHLVEPDIDYESIKSRELLAYLMGIKQLGYLGATELAQDAKDAMDEREESQGN